MLITQNASYFRHFTSMQVTMSDAKHSSTRNCQRPLPVHHSQSQKHSLPHSPQTYGDSLRAVPCSSQLSTSSVEDNSEENNPPYTRMGELTDRML